MTPGRSADFEGLLRALAAHGVPCIVIDGVSAALQGVPATTYDLDLVLDPDPAHLDRAFELLQELDACLRKHLPAKRLELARADLDTPGAKLLQTRLGPLDILGVLANGWRFADFEPRSRELVFSDGLRARVLDLAALIEVKEAVGREKDRAVLPLYRSVLRERDARPPE